MKLIGYSLKPKQNTRGWRGPEYPVSRNVMPLSAFENITSFGGAISHFVSSLHLRVSPAFNSNTPGSIPTNRSIHTVTIFDLTMRYPHFNFNSTEDLTLVLFHFNLVECMSKYFEGN